jgi:hypothetical protein
MIVEYAFEYFFSVHVMAFSSFFGTENSVQYCGHHSIHFVLPRLHKYGDFGPCVCLI